ncbi:MAG: NADH-quinone oxidoreductase subunit NuoE [Bacteroidales bacterium]|nr:NADH-quinone oxidoreductase subunit NuoE [Bacteroidales bacterium]
MRIERIFQKEEIEVQDSVNIELLEPIIEKHKNKKGNMIPLLQEVQDLYGYLPEQALRKISEETNLGLSEMYGVATFYSQFRITPVGKHIIKVCHGTACHVQNSDAITEALENFLEIKDGETTKDRLFTLESVACLGCCSLAPVMMIDGETFGKLTGKKAEKILKDIKKKELNK